MPPVVRIAPSPSGYLHVGTARTAIFNYLFARRNGGEFLIRIEDTDKERSDASLVEPIVAALKWLGIESDRPLVYQSQRTELHAAYARRVLESGHAYHCFCSPESLERKRTEAMAQKRQPRYDGTCRDLAEAKLQEHLRRGDPYAIRLRVPPGEISFDDLVSGRLAVKSEDVEDFIIARSDGSAVYNMAVVVDDNEMGITHVIRGNDHITNTFKQILIYRALGLPIPVFGHLPLILRPDKRKVSKRLGDKDVNIYAEEGILPSAMFNYLSLLGWSPKTDREIYQVQELIAIFTPDHLNASNAVFDEEKLVAFNKEHILAMSLNQLTDVVVPYFVSAGLTTQAGARERRHYLEQVVGLLRERVRRLTDFAHLGRFLFEFNGEYDQAAAEKQFTPERGELLAAYCETIRSAEPFTHDTLESLLGATADARGVKKAEIIHPARLAVSGMSVGPGLYQMLELLGRDRVLERIDRAVAFIRSRKSA